MTDLERTLRTHARKIWDAAVAAANPEVLVREAVANEFADAGRIVVVGGGKAGAAMAAGLEVALADRLDRVEGILNVPAGSERPLRKIALHVARPAGTNHPTAEGVTGTERMLDLLASAGPEDVAICLLSGGGSALLPAPVAGVSLEDKQVVTKLLHSCGATINEMNAVRKHLSRVKGGGMVRALRGKKLVSLIISDVVGDPLDVIASGPTAADPSTFQGAWDVLVRYDLLDRIPAAMRSHLKNGIAGTVPETLKQLPTQVDNRVVGSNAKSLSAANAAAEQLGYRVLNLGAFVEGETRQVAIAVAGIARSIRRDRVPVAPPACILVGGETTVTLGDNPGKGGRNQEFALATWYALLGGRIDDVVVLSGGTDGEDGPTDAAGAIAGDETLRAMTHFGWAPRDYLDRHDAFHFFEATGDLLKTGLTGTNVMDVRVILIP
jgi:hydroxypyruvate reductase/glycerate 2-kinase